MGFSIVKAIVKAIVMGSSHILIHQLSFMDPTEYYKIMAVSPEVHVNGSSVVVTFTIQLHTCGLL